MKKKEKCSIGCASGYGKPNSFSPFFTGSVIPFLRTEDLKQVIQEALVKIDHASLKESLTIMQSLEKHHEVISKQLELIRQAKKALMYKVLR